MAPRYPSRAGGDRLPGGLSAGLRYPAAFSHGSAVGTEIGDGLGNGDGFRSIESNYVVMATGAYGKPRTVEFLGQGSYPGRVLHSYEYKTGAEFAGQRVLVIGFGNSACEIAIDLVEHGAVVSMAVRSAVGCHSKRYFRGAGGGVELIAAVFCRREWRMSSVVRWCMGCLAMSGRWACVGNRMVRWSRSCGKGMRRCWILVL